MSGAMRPARYLALVAAFALPAPTGRPPGRPPSALDRYDMADRTASRHRLPDALREVSGLAVSADGRLFAHGDERAVVYEVDPRSGRVRSSFALGNPPVRGDFEGLAIVGPRLFLVTSDGTLFESRLGANGAVMPYVRRATGLGRACEVEGLAHARAADALLLPCKTPRVPELEGRVAVFAYDLAAMRLDPVPRLSIPVREVAGATGRAGFHASAIEVDPAGGTLLLVAGIEATVVEVTLSGVVLGGRRLPRGRHPQPEGLALTRDLTLLLADEARDGGGTLTSYRRRD